MWHRHKVIPNLASRRIRKWFAEMQAKLVPKEIEVDPCVTGTPLGCPQWPGIEVSCAIKIQNIEGQMKGYRHWCVLNY